MATNVLIIAEDYRNDQYILKPVIKAMMKQLGKPNANVRMCRDPMLAGLAQVLHADNMRDVIETNPLADLYVLIIDRDGDVHREERLKHLQTSVADRLRPGQAMLGVQAHQEVEVWLLAGQTDLPGAWQWQDVRDEINAKESYYESYASARGVATRLGGGRKVLGDEAARRYMRIRRLCDEVMDLETRIGEYLNA